MNRIIIAALVLSAVTANAQVKDGMVGINTDEPRATMHIEPGVSESKGLIIPRITAAQMKTMTNLAHFGADHHAIITYLKEQLPAADRTGKLVDVAEPGYYYYDNTTGVQKWKAFGGGEQDLRMVGTNNHLTKDAGVGGNGTSLGTSSRNIGIGYSTFGGFTNPSQLTGGFNTGLGSYIYVNSGGTMSGSMNTAIGQSLYTMMNGGNMAGERNIALGIYSFEFHKTNAQFPYTASYNIGIGYRAFHFQNGDLTGGANIGMGSNLYNLVSGNMEGSRNIGIGQQSYYVNKGNITNTANNNIALGNSIYRLSNSSTSTFSGQNNIGIGNILYNLPLGNLTGQRNIGMGDNVFDISSGDFSGNYNIGIGNYPMRIITGDFSGNYNIGIGSNAMSAFGGITGSNNIALGYNSIRTSGKLAGTDNIAIGNSVLQPASSSTDIGSYNIGIGNYALYEDMARGNANIQIGNWYVGTPVAGQLNNVVAIGNQMNDLATSSTDSDTILLGIAGSSTPKIGMGTYKPQAKLHVNGSIIIANDTNTCNNDTEGAIRYNRPSKKFEGCDGTNWVSLN